MQINPLSRRIAVILEEQAKPISEFELIKQLELDQCDIGIDAPQGSDLALFRHHFLVMNALYTLQPIYHQRGFYLSISALSISLTPLSCNQQSLPFQSADHQLRAYYLDWDELDKSCEESVESLLNSFWDKYLSYDHIAEALSVLGVDESSSWTEIQKQYRVLASQTHPDKAGDPIRFHEIREAYETLSKHKAQF